MSPDNITDAKAKLWRDTWQEVAGKYAEMQIPLRLLDVAVRYREKKTGACCLSFLSKNEKSLSLC